MPLARSARSARSSPVGITLEAALWVGRQVGQVAKERHMPGTPVKDWMRAEISFQARGGRPPGTRTPVWAGQTTTRCLAFSTPMSAYASRTTFTVV